MTRPAPVSIGCRRVSVTVELLADFPVSMTPQEIADYVSSQFETLRRTTFYADENRAEPLVAYELLSVADPDTGEDLIEDETDPSLPMGENGNRRID